MKNNRINRIEVLHALNEWCAGRFNPLIAFPSGKGFPNVIYLYEEKQKEMLELGVPMMESIQHQVGTPVMVFVEPRKSAPKVALSYKEWIESGQTMKATELVTGDLVYVIPVYDNDGKVKKYVSSEKSYNPDDLVILKAAEQ